MKKKIAILLCLALIMSSGAVSFANSGSFPNIVDIDEYQLIVDKINKEYGTNLKLPTAEDLKRLESYGVDTKMGKSVDMMSLIEFEEKMIEIAKDFVSFRGGDWHPASQFNGASIAEPQFSGESIAESQFKQFTKESDMATRATIRKEKSKKLYATADVCAGTFYLDATVQDTSGHWQFYLVHNARSNMVGANTSKAYFETYTWTATVMDYGKLSWTVYYGRLWTPQAPFPYEDGQMSTYFPASDWEF